MLKVLGYSLAAGEDVCQGARQVSGLYTKAHLPPGVNLITTIPRGSCRLNISLLRPHNNHLGILRSYSSLDVLKLIMFSYKTVGW